LFKIRRESYGETHSGVFLCPTVYIYIYLSTQVQYRNSNEIQ